MVKKVISFFDKISLFSICCVIFLVIFDSHLQKIFIFIGIGAMLISKLFSYIFKIKPLFKKTYLDRPMLLFLSAILLATFFSRNFYESQKVFFDRILVYAGIFLLVKEAVYSKKRLYIILGTFIFVSFLCGFDALWQYFTGLDLFFGFPRNSCPFVGKLIALTGPFGRYNSFSGFLEITLPLIAFLCLIKKNKYFTIFICLILLSLLISWIFVFQRSTWISVSLSCLIVSFFLKRKYAIILLSVLLLISIFSPIQVYEKAFWQLLKDKDVSSGRLEMWHEAIRLIKERPILGSGLGAYGMYAGSKHLHAHNTYLELFVDAGVIGLIGLILLILIFLKKSLHALISEEEEEKKIITAALLASCVSSFIVALFSTNMIVGIRFASLFWIILSLAVILKDINFKAKA